MPALRYWDAGSSQYVLLTPGATTFPFTYMQTLSAPTVASSPYQINHNLNTTTPIIQVWDAVTGQLVEVQVRMVNANSIQISVATNMPNNVNVIVVGSAQSPIPVQPADLVNKAYVDARTPNLPAPVTSGSGIQSFTDALGDVWVAQNGTRGGNWYRARDVLHARYYRNAPMNTNSATLVNVAMDTKVNDPYSMAATGANWGYTAPIPGLYQITYQASMQATTSGQGIMARLYDSSSALVGANLATNAWATAQTIAALIVGTWVLGAGGTLTTYVTASSGLPMGVGFYWTYACFDYLGTG